MGKITLLVNESSISFIKRSTYIHNFKWIMLRILKQHLEFSMHANKKLTNLFKFTVPFDCEAQRRVRAGKKD